jgi:serine-type D-Ala-D-Ala endopeptidase (penicillin-binding protein 7)
VKLAETGRELGFINTNSLVRSDGWNIGLSKTGFINEAGKCLVMQAIIGSKPVVIVLMDSWGRYTRAGDANRIKKWLESGKIAVVPAAVKRA